MYIIIYILNTVNAFGKRIKQKKNAANRPSMSSIKYLCYNKK